VPTIAFACGAECGNITAGSAPVAPVVQHWNTVTGAVAIETVTVRTAGTKSYKFASAGTPLDLRHTFASNPTTGVIRCYIRFSSLPAVIINICGFVTAGGSFCGVRYNPTGTLLQSVAVGAQTGGKLIVVDTWYRLDIRVTTSATPLST